MHQEHEIRMEHTDGPGRGADIWLDGVMLRVCDGLSRPGCRCRPGLLEDVQLRYHNDESYTWDQALAGNPAGKSGIEPVKGWAYVGYGQVEQVMPVVINFAGLRMQDPNWSNDESLVGRFVRVPMNRLEIAPASRPDWPGDLCDIRARKKHCNGTSR